MVKTVQDRIWTIPAERSKNGRENRVYLTDLAFSLLPEIEENEYVFPASRGSHGAMYINTMAHHLSHHNNPAYLGLPRWPPHDLRRTAQPASPPSVALTKSLTRSRTTRKRE